jgi:acyl-coenzyme A synthetase/AMP-(fatty) acid ligase
MAARDLLAEPPPNLRLIVVAGDRVPDDLVVQADRRGIALLEYYGATELLLRRLSPIGCGRTRPGRLSGACSCASRTG